MPVSMQVVPTRVVRNAQPRKAARKGPVQSEAEVAEAPAFDPDELLPRADISDKIRCQTAKVICSHAAKLGFPYMPY